MLNNNFEDDTNTTPRLREKSVKSSTRFYALDSLRAAAMILGVLLHASLANMLNHFPFWPIQDPNQYPMFDFISCSIHIFRLELFFLIAGFFTNFIYQNKSVRQFIKNRIIRIGIPFIITWPFMVAFWLVIPVKQTVPSAIPHELPIYHLWFLYYLFFYYIAFLCVNFIMRFSKKLWEWVDAAFCQLIQQPYYQVILVGITACIMLFMNKVYVDTPFGFTPLYRLLFHYGVFFSFGVLLHRQSNLLTTLAQHRRLYLYISIPSTVLLLIQFFNSALSPESINLQVIALRVNYAIVSWSLVLCFIGYFQQYLNQYNPIIRYLADASYWIYLAHLPFVIGSQYFLLDTPVPGLLRPFLAFGGTLLVLLMSYHFIVRFTWIGRILNGPRLRPMLPILRY